MRRLTLGSLLVLTVAASGTAPPTADDGAHVRPDRNVELLGHFDAYTSYSDVWGHSASDGRELALIGTFDGTSIVDATDPASLDEIAFIAGPPSSWRDIKTWDRYAYVVTEGTGAGQGLQIVDLEADPVPRLVDTYAVGFTTAHNLFIDERGYAYVVGTAGGMFVLSLATPTAPVQVGVYDERYVHDVYVRDGIAYASQMFRGRIDALDVREPASTVSVGTTTYFGAFPHNGWLTDDGRYLVHTDEQPGGHLHVIDVGDLDSMVEVARWQRDPEQTIHNATVLGEHGFVSHYSHGLRVVELTDPRFPTEVGGFDTLPDDAGHDHDQVLFDGAWGVYPFSPSGNVYVSDISTGLYVFAFTPEYAAFSGTVREAGSGEPLAGARVSVDDGTAVLAIDDGSYRITAPTGTATISFERFGYRTLSSTLTVPAGPFTLDVDLERRRSGALEGAVEGAGELEGAVVTLLGTDEATRVDAAGRYRFDVVPVGYHRLRVDRPGFVPQVVGTRVTVDQTAVLDVALEPATTYHDMETADGWVVGAPGDGATSGLWTRLDPNGTLGGAANPEDDATPGAGSHAWVTGDAGPDLEFAVADVDGGRTTLTSPDLVLPAGGPTAILSYERWYSNDTNFAPDDELRIEISADDGPWEALETLDATDVPWRSVEVDLSAWPGAQTVRLRVIAEDFGSGSIVEAALDDVAVWASCQIDVVPGLADTDADRTTDACDPCPLDPLDDADGDGACADVDNAPAVANVDQQDVDLDGVGDLGDNCPEIANADQWDADRDGVGNACDDDDDDDGIPDESDPDVDGDGVDEPADRCPGVRDPQQLDGDGDGVGDRCDPDDGAVGALVFDSAEALVWDAEIGVDAYRVRRGTVDVAGGAVDVAAAACLAPDRAVTAAVEPFLPEVGTAFFYLVTTVSGGVEGSAGTSSDGAERAPGPACP